MALDKVRLKLNPEDKTIALKVNELETLPTLMLDNMQQL